MKIAVVGAGKLGLKVINALLSGDHSITVIDSDEDVISSLSSHMDVMAVCDNGKQISTLKDIHISSYDYLLTATDSDEQNIVIASFAKKLGCSRVIARVRDPEHMQQMDFIRDTMSIDYLVNPDFAITMEIYKYLVEKYTLSNGIFSVGKVSFLEFYSKKVPALIGKGTSDIPFIMPGMLLLAVSHNGKLTIPDSNTVISEDDILYMIGEKNSVAALSKKVHEKGKYTDLQKVMIIGGGKTGLYLAKKLSEFGILVKIVERDRERCYYLTEFLDDVIVLNGDGTDQTLLEEENIDSMDAFVTATGYDEDNLLLALMAKHRDIEDVIAKVSRDIYLNMVSDMGVDMVLNPLDITTSNILRIIQGSRRILSSQLIQGQAELLEVLVDEDMFFANTRISELKLPKGVMIAAIHRGLDVIIPTGATEIKEDDRVTMLVLLSEMPTLEKMLKNKERFLG